MQGTVVVDASYFVEVIRQNEAMKQRIELLENYIMEDNWCDGRLVLKADMLKIGITNEQLRLFEKGKELED